MQFKSMRAICAAAADVVHPFTLCACVCVCEKWNGQKLAIKIINFCVRFYYFKILAIARTRVFALSDSTMYESLTLLLAWFCQQCNEICVSSIWLLWKVCYYNCHHGRVFVVISLKYTMYSCTFVLTVLEQPNNSWVVPFFRILNFIMTDSRKLRSLHKKKHEKI